MTGAALVLAGGGRVGIAWELGMLRGIELGSPGLIGRIRDPATTYIGTSAGSVVAAQLALGGHLDDLLRAESESAPAEKDSAQETPFHVLPMVAAMITARIGAKTPEDSRRRIGAYALKAQGISEDAWIDSIASRFERTTWPERRLLINAVDVHSGEHRVFDRDSGVDLVRAVAASCSVPGVFLPVSIDGRRYMDGGMRSIANADLAAGCDPVLILAPLRGGAGLGNVKASELASLGGARVHVEYADRAASRAFGRNPLDDSTRAASAAAGLRQGRDSAAALSAFWE